MLGESAVTSIIYVCKGNFVTQCVPKNVYTLCSAVLFYAVKCHLAECTSTERSVSGM